MVVPKKLTAIIILLGRNLSTVHTQITLRFKALVINYSKEFIFQVILMQFASLVSCNASELVIICINFDNDGTLSL